MVEVVALEPLLQVPAGCDVCGGGGPLVVRVLGRLHCARCWRWAGKPGPAPSDDRERLQGREQHELEEEQRKKMAKRGGADLHMVRSGRT